ncbi:uncharacterized protein LOC107270827 isoform X2 [Cephus cinctus]|uniref:Uncharacterized protein LOC107270827 isoform X2 n=1 Tax=Cephus cinctus TaxID=211228 RepID=A0AAJ7RN08_CEPCN|nr:uncharacterized protein LOC107270827 isoform X2 [Cephus cinctus]
MPRHPWQRSASCRELYASSFEDSGKARPKSEKPAGGKPLLETFQLPSQGELDNPVTRYDESNRSYSAASSKLPSLDHDSVPEKVYSSSYPGTSSLSTESGHEESGPVGDLSHDDLSHDSYELLEREQEFEYPESYSSPRDDNEPISDNSDEGIEHEMFQMDSETDSFVKHRSIKSTDKQHFKSVLADLKNVKSKSIDRYSAPPGKGDADHVVTESRIQRSNTQIERKFETRHANSIEQQRKSLLPHQDSNSRKDPLIIQVQKQKMTLLNEIKNLKPKYKITHVDSEVLRDEGIMRPKSRIDDDLSPLDPERTILDQNNRGRTMRARSIASLEDDLPRHYVETGSLGRGHKSRERKTRETEAKMEKLLSKMQEKERRSIEREERKRVERENSREIRRMEKADSRERRSIERLDLRERRSMERLDSRELRRSIERLNSRERSYERLDSAKERSSLNRATDPRGKSIERSDSRELRKSMESLERDSRSCGNVTRRADSRERKERSVERLDSRGSPRSPGRPGLDCEQRHTLERFDSGSRSPFEHLPLRESRGKSVERLDSKERPTFDFDPRTIERLSSLERRDSKERVQERRRSGERRSMEKLDSWERRSMERLDRGSLDVRRSSERLDCSKETRRCKTKPERGKSDEKPRERDDWKSLERARKDDERRERERQSRLFMESRTETVIGIPNEMDSKIKAVFTEYDPKVIGGVVLGFDDTALPAHTPVERTKSDPNPARQRIGSNSKRHMLTHQKSIDLTPAGSGDEDPFSDSVPKSNVEIPYTLHKRHVMNGTASDEKSESDSGKTSKTAKALPKDLPKLPLKTVTDVSCLDLTKIASTEKTVATLSPDRPRSILISPDKPRSILISPDKQRSTLSPTSKVSPVDQNSIVSSFSPIDKSPSREIPSYDKCSNKSNSLVRARSDASFVDRSKSPSLDKKTLLSPVEPSVTIISAIEKRSPKLSPNEAGVTIISMIEKRKPESGTRSPGTLEKTHSREKAAINFADVVGMEIKQELERREKEKLKVPEDGLEKQDSIEKIPLPEIPVKNVDQEESPLPVKQGVTEKRAEVLEKSIVPEKPPLPPKQNLLAKQGLSEQSSRKSEMTTSPEADKSNRNDIPGKSEESNEKSKLPEKPSIPEKTKRILDRIESRFTEISKNSPTKVSRPKIIDTGYDDFVDPVADLPLDEVPVKPALELDSLKVPEFTPFMLRPHAEPLRSKSLSLAEDKAPIDTLLSPEVENKHFVQDISPKRAKKMKSEPKKDFKKQSKSLEADKPPLKKTGSKESRTSPASSKIDKSKLKLGEMPQEIIIIDSTDVAPEVSIVQKGRSKSVTKLSDRSFSTSKEEKEESKKPRAKSASVDDDMIKGSGNLKSDKPRPKSLGISKSLGSTEKKDSLEKISPKRTTSVKSTVKTNSVKPESSKLMTPTKADPKPEESRSEIKSDSDADQSSDLRRSSTDKRKDSKVETKSDSDADQSSDPKRSKPDRKKDTRKAVSGQELAQSPIVLRKPGQSPVLFARARLGLSEGSGMGALKRQSVTLSPTAQRRAKSLDAPVISVHRLPPANAFSSKDDTVDVSEGVEDQENGSDENVEANQVSKPQSIQMEASPNHKSDSTDHTTIPEFCTDSLSVTETSAQYLESPLTECNEIVTCPDLIPYEQEVQLQFMRDSTEISEPKSLPETTKFIDQSSAESGTEPEPQQEATEVKSDKISRSTRPSKLERVGTLDFSRHRRSKSEFSSGTDSSDGERHGGQVKMSIDQNSYKKETFLESSSRSSTDKDEPPNVMVSSEINVVLPEIDDFNQDNKQDMVKSPIQISIEECSDEEIPRSDQEDELQETFHVDIKEKKRLDSGDTSEDTLDALDTQVQVQGADSELSSPDYGADKMDEKTLVEVELTPEYLDMKKEDEEGAEELPEDEPADKEAKDVLDNNRLSIDRKLRLSTERSRSEETNTWTPDREDPDSSSCSIARPLGIGQIQPIIDRREIAMIKESRKEGSMEEESSSGSHPAPKVELSSTWKPFPLESSGSSSLEEGWLPQDDNNQPQSQSEDSNGQNEDSFQEDLADFSVGFGYAIGPEILANYGCAFSLSRTLSRISERSTTSEQDKSDLEDSFKPSSRSPSLDDESLMSSDHQPSLSSDPPSGTALPSVSDDRRTSSELPDIPIDIVNTQEDEARSPKVKSKLQLQASEDWPSPPSSPLFDTPVVSHVETFYMEIKPEEAVKVMVTDSTDTPERVDHDSDSSDENRTLHDDLHSTLLEDGQSSASATTVDGTIKIAVKPKSNSYITGSSHSEDTSMGLSMSEWSSSNNTVRQFCQYSGTKSDDNSLAELGASISDWSGSTTVIPQQYYSAVGTEKSQSDTTTSEKSVTSMRPNSKCQRESNTNDSPPVFEQSGNVILDEGQFDYEAQFDGRQFDSGNEPEETEKVDEDEAAEFDEAQLPDIPGPIPEEDEEEQLYDNVPAMKYSSSDQVRMEVTRGDSYEDMHERYASLASSTRYEYDEDRVSYEDQKTLEAKLQKRFEEKPLNRFERGYSEPVYDQRHGTRSTERPVIVPIRAKSTPYYSTTSLSGESTTSSPPMQVKAQIRTKTMTYSSSRSPQSEGDTSSSMDSPGHTPEPRAFRRKRQQNIKRRHRVVVDLEVKGGHHIVSSTDSSFDVANIPPPLLTEQSVDIDDDELSDSKNNEQCQKRR